MNRKVIIFDFDGVLFDSQKLLEDYMMDLYPGLTKEMTKELVCGNFPEEIQKINLPKKVETEDERAKLKILYSKNKLEVPMFTGMAELLEDLYTQGYILVINTSAFERNCLPMLEKNKIVQFFDYIATIEVARSKVEKFKLIQDKYSVSTDKLLFITDTLGDIREADEAGVPTVAVTWGAHDRSYFYREEHKNLVAVVDSVDELRKVITN